MAITLNGTTGITTPDIDTDGLSVDTNAIFVDPATNNVGIGTSSPGTKLDVNGGFAVLGSVSGFSGGEARLGTSTADTQSAVSTISTGSPQLLFDHRGSNSGSFIWRSGVNESARIDSSGNLLVGQTASSGSGRQEISFAPSSQVGFRFNMTDTTFSNAVMEFRTNSPTRVGFIFANGSSTTYSTSSDYRLKENVAPMTSALEKVQALNPVTYTWKVDGSVGQGFIAHELQAVVPDCVTGEKDAVRTVDVHDEEGKVIGTKEEPRYQGVDTSFLVGILTAAIQEQQTLIQALTARIEALEQA